MAKGARDQPKTPLQHTRTVPALQIRPFYRCGAVWRGAAWRGESKGGWQRALGASVAIGAGRIAPATEPPQIRLNAWVCH